MTKVIVWNGGWQGGNRAELDIGRTYYQSDLQALGIDVVKSMLVPDGVKVNACRWPDNKWNNAWDRVILYPNNYYEDCGYWLGDGGFRSITTEFASGIKANECVRVYQDGAWHYGRGGYARYWNLPVGTSEASKLEFIYDVITDVHIPEGMSAEFIDWNKGKTSVTLYGNPGGSTYSLANHGLNDRVDTVVVALDSYTHVRTEYDTQHATDEDGGVLAVLTSRADNREGVADFTDKVGFSQGFERSVTTSWENSTGVTITAEVEVGGEASPVKAKFGVGVSNTTSVGKSKTSSETVTLTKEIDATIPVGKQADVCLEVRQRKGEMPFTAVFRNDRTGAEIRRRGSVSVSYALAGSSYVKAV